METCSINVNVFMPNESTSSMQQLYLLNICMYIFFSYSLGSKLAKMDNRHLLGLCLLLALAGSLLAGDWQSIAPGDPCSTALVSEDDSYGSGFSSSCMDRNDTGFIEQNLERCEGQSNSSQCFWNPQSRITGKFCNTCLNTCLSKQKSQNIYLFSIGVLLLSMSAPLGFVFVSAIVSDITSVESQVCFKRHDDLFVVCLSISVEFLTQGAVLTIATGAGALSRAVSPFWRELI